MPEIPSPPPGYELVRDRLGRETVGVKVRPSRSGTGVRRIRENQLKYFAALTEAMPFADFKSIVGKLKELALEGDLGAMKLLFDKILPSANTIENYYQIEIQGKHENTFNILQVTETELEAKREAIRKQVLG